MNKTSSDLGQRAVADIAAHLSYVADREITPFDVTIALIKLTNKTSTRRVTIKAGVDRRTSKEVR